MKIGIIGFPQSGKTTIFNALTGASLDINSSQSKKEPNIAVVNVPDERVDKLSEMYKPKKTTYAQVQYFDIAIDISKDKEKDITLGDLIKHVRNADALLLVLRNFELHGIPPEPQKEYDTFVSEFILNDLIIVENRLTKIEKEAQKGKKYDPKEHELLKRALHMLNSNIPLRNDPEITSFPNFKGFMFLTTKPLILILNSSDDAEKGITNLNTDGAKIIEIKGKLEMELMQLNEEDAAIFREEMGIKEPAIYRVVKESYKTLGLISFFTVGEDEVKAWTIKDGTRAQKAAGCIHSDMERGFIRAEVIHYNDLMEAGSYLNAQKAGKVRLEGKDYIVKDGDIINFKFNI